MSEKTSLFKEKLIRSKYRVAVIALGLLAVAGCGDTEPVKAQEIAPPAASSTEFDEHIDRRTPEQITADVKEASIEHANDILTILELRENEARVISDSITTMEDDNGDLLKGPEAFAGYSAGGEAPTGIVGQLYFEATTPSLDDPSKVHRLTVALDVVDNNPLAEAARAGEPLSIDLLKKALDDEDSLRFSMLSPLTNTEPAIGSEQLGLSIDARGHTNTFTAEGTSPAEGPTSDKYLDLADTVMKQIKDQL